jgi:wyosine [tRNA(Phe)-imidazoG37] synthetase (radical SAM superfamily)
MEYKDAHLTKKEILISRGIVKEDNIQNILHQKKLPRGFTINFCGHCTYKCSYCPQSFEEYPVEFIREEIVYKVFNELGNKAVYVQMGSRGENLLHPKFFDFIEFIKNKNELSYICLNTNGLIIDDDMMLKLLSVIDQIVFSVQTTEPDLYKKIVNNHGFEKVVGRIIRFEKARNELNSKTLLSVQYLAFTENLPFKQKFIDFWKGHNLEVLISSFHSWGDKFAPQEEPVVGRYPCAYLWLYPTVTHTGKLTACFADFYDEIAYGSLEKSSMGQLWHGEKILFLREKHLKGEWGDIPLCRNCDGFLFMDNVFEYREGRYAVKETNCVL